MEKIYQLVFKKGSLLNSMYFVCPDLQTAVAKGRKFCDKKGLKFIYVAQWLRDIDEMINFESNDPEIEE